MGVIPISELPLEYFIVRRPFSDEVGFILPQPTLAAMELAQTIADASRGLGSRALYRSWHVGAHSAEVKDYMPADETEDYDRSCLMTVTDSDTSPLFHAHLTMVENSRVGAIERETSVYYDKIFGQYSICRSDFKDLWTGRQMVKNELMSERATLAAARLVRLKFGLPKSEIA